MEQTNQYRPLWVEPEFMKTLGFDQVKDKDGYLKYENDGKTFIDDYYRPGLPAPKGKRIIYFNCTYAPQKEVVFVGIMEDGETRTGYHGVCSSEEFLKHLIQNVR